MSNATVLPPQASEPLDYAHARATLAVWCCCRVPPSLLRYVSGAPALLDEDVELLQKEVRRHSVYARRKAHIHT
jgi:hypothetical protein